MINNSADQSTSNISMRDNYLHRPAVYNLLEESLKKPVTVILAGAGFGKTQTVSAYLQAQDVVIIWSQLSRHDNLPIRLWENFVYAVSQQNESLFKKLTELGFPESMASYQRFLDILSEETRKGKKHVIVYDDFYLIQDKQVLAFFDNFVNESIPNLSFILISRREPEINTVGLLAKNMLSRITEDDFRFSEIEMNKYFHMLGIHISPKTSSDIYRYTDGWIFAIHLIALSLKKGKLKEDYAIMAVKDNIDKLIEKELFFAIPSEMQKFLLLVSLLDDVPVELLKELFPDSDNYIVELYKIGSFVRYDAFTNTFRIHHIFLHFLHERRVLLDNAEIETIYRRAAEWYDKKGLKIDAITFYEKIQDYNGVFRVAMTFPFRFPLETALFMIGVINRAPEMVIETKPLLRVLYCRLLLSINKYADAKSILLELRDKYKSLNNTEENNIILCEIYIMLGIVETNQCFITGNLGNTREFYQKALEYCPEGSRISKNISTNLSPYIIGANKNCDFRPILEELNVINEYYKKLLNGICYGSYEMAQAEYCYFRKDMKKAEQYALLSITKTLEAKQFHIENMAHFYLIRIYMAIGNYAKTIERLNLLKAQAEKQNHLDSYTMFDIAAGWFYSSIEETNNVALWIKDVKRNSADILSSSIFGLDVLVQARCYLAEKMYNDILTLLEDNKNGYLSYYLLGRLEMLVLKAVCLYYLREQNDAMAALQDAYELSLPNSFIMPFIELGSAMRTLANAAINHPNCKIPPKWLKEIRTMSSTYSKRINQIQKDYAMKHSTEAPVLLTKKETDILKDICMGLTREEVAAEHGLSMNTVKSMMSNIFLKLGAVNVQDAIRIAFENKLFS